VDAAFDAGIVGGSRRDQLAETKAIAAAALRVLRGARADDIPVSRLMLDVVQVDWRQLRRWGIDEARVPAGATVLFREPSLWHRYKRYIIGALALMLTQAMLIAGLLVQRSLLRRAGRRLSASRDELRASYDRIRHLGRHLLGVQEAERALIARELHDDIDQQLALLAMELESLRPDPQQVEGRTRLSNALDRTRMISTSVHHLSHRLHPAMLQLVGLVAAIDNLQRDFSRPQQSVVFSHRDVPEIVDPDAALCLFRVAQEALTNAAKHSGAAHVRVDLFGRPNDLVLTVTDDGRGFAVAASNGGLGLTSMKERVESAGGTLEIHSTPGSGTNVRATVPIRTLSAAADVLPA
jgi:signal transduction histidine kinase